VECGNPFIQGRTGQIQSIDSPAYNRAKEVFEIARDEGKATF